jgi:hypothetical protein
MPGLKYDLYTTISTREPAINKNRIIVDKLLTPVIVTLLSAEKTDYCTKKNGKP